MRLLLVQCRRSTVALCVFGMVLASALAVLLGFQTNPAAGHVTEGLAVGSTVVMVTAGKPSEFAFELSKHEVPPGKIVFSVRNAGTTGHTFRICSSPDGGTALSCVGKATTPLLAPGSSATLTVTLTKGTYEYLSTVAGHAAAGMRGLLGVGIAPPKVSIAAAPTINVIAGKPSELAFELSKTRVSVGTTVFYVKNEGTLTHSFKVCMSPKGGTADACAGTATPLLAPGKTAYLIVTLAKGTYEYLCTVPGHAAAGMKGVLGVGEVAPVTPTPTPTPTPVTTSATPTTPVAPPATLVGDPTAGAGVFASAACGSCHTLAAAGATGTGGPDLDTLMPSEALVDSTVTSGFGEMPSFSGTLSAQQIADVAAYVATSTGGSMNGA